MDAFNDLFMRGALGSQGGGNASNSRNKGIFPVLQCLSGNTLCYDSAQGILPADTKGLFDPSSSMSAFGNSLFSDNGVTRVMGQIHEDMKKAAQGIKIELGNMADSMSGIGAPQQSWVASTASSSNDSGISL